MMRAMTAKEPPETNAPDAFTCPHCKAELTAEANSWKAGQVGKHTSEKKARSSAENGKKGGRPRKLPKLDTETQA